jgi:hypothetical protein
VFVAFVSLAMTIAACSDDPVPAELDADRPSPPAATATAATAATSRPATETPSPTATPVVTAASPDSTPESAGGEVALPPGLPRVDGEIETAVRGPDGAIAVTWAVSAPPGEVVAALADAIAEGFELLLDERAPGGGVIAFGGALAGHYLVTAVDGETRVELRLDPPPAPSATPTVAVTLPDGYPDGTTPVFPGATVVAATSEPLDGARVHYIVTFETARQPVEVIGFYRDLLAADGWDVSAQDGGLEASEARGTASLTVNAGAPTRGVLRLDWAP